MGLYSGGLIIGRIFGLRFGGLIFGSFFFGGRGGGGGYYQSFTVYVMGCGTVLGACNFKAEIDIFGSRH